MVLGEDWGECRNCGRIVGSGDGIKVVRREEDSARSTVLCPDCAVLLCENCGTPVPVSSVFEEEKRGGNWVLTCDRCEEDVLLDEMVEIRNEHDPNYRKRICADCFEEVSIPSGYAVHRDVSAE